MRSAFFFILFLACSHSLAGKDRGGGDMVASEFASLQSRAAKLVTYHHDKFPEVSLEKLRYTSESLRVESKDSLVLDGFVKDAINTPADKLIEINRETWPKLSKDDRYTLAVHELLGLLAIPDPQYRVSRRVIPLAQNSDILNLVDLISWEDLLSRALAIPIEMDCEVFVQGKVIPDMKPRPNPTRPGVFQSLRTAGLLLTLTPHLRTNVMGVKTHFITTDNGTDVSIETYRTYPIAERIFVPIPKRNLTAEIVCNLKQP